MKTTDMEIAISIITAMVREDAEAGKVNHKLIDSLHTLISSWSIIRTEQASTQLKNSLLAMNPSGPEIPIPFKPHKVESL